jgi:negative regulator of sigma-B (phosphoserine phosphatase)
MVSRPRQGETVSGDCIGIWQKEESTLVTVIDGLGSGPAAARASEKALASVEANQAHRLPEILVRCHRAVRATRGVVMALLRVDHGLDQVQFLGVGNIGFSAASKGPMQPFSQNGLLGHRLPSLLEFEFDCSPGDLMALFSDGISSEFVRRGGISSLARMPPQALAEHIACHFGRHEDDVAVLILEVTGSQAAA